MMTPQLRNETTGEIAPAHEVGTDDATGSPVYQWVAGWEPTQPYDTDGEVWWSAPREPRESMHVEIYEAVGGGLIAQLVEGGEVGPIDQFGIAWGRESVPYVGTEIEFAAAIWLHLPGAPIIGLDGRVVADAE